ncbi:glycosyl transferase [Rhodobacterales bacterium 52_120_T64]|nr:glycosyl transferase [Rhodobacterales bacterium 52_120_T64]
MEQKLHPFAKFIQILARGKTKTRAFTLEESQEAMAMILRGEAKPEQIGAFLMLLRLKEETPEEIAGFTMGTRDTFELPDNIPDVDVDWSSYAGKRRQLPWFILSALLLAQNGFKVFMHGTGGHTPGRIYTRETLQKLGFPIAHSFDQAVDHLAVSNFCYVSLEVLSPKLRELIEMRPTFGLRSPVHSFARMLNPFNAPVMMQGIFHRGFMDIHAGAGLLLDQPVTTVFRGEGGEIERRPNKPTIAWTAANGEITNEEWPALLPNGHAVADEDMDIQNLIAIWRGEQSSEYAEASVIGTLAVALKSMGQAETIVEAQAMAQGMWVNRDRSGLPVAA